jgi:hypothetical protein
MSAEETKRETKGGNNRLARADKARKAVELRRTGASYDAIAGQLGYANRSGAWKAVQQALKRSVRESGDAVRQLENDRLDRLLLSLWKRALEGDLEALDRVLKIMKRRAELNGLDAPKQLALQMSDEELDRAIEGELERLAKGSQSAAAGAPASC